LGDDRGVRDVAAKLVLDSPSNLHRIHLGEENRCAQHSAQSRPPHGLEHHATFASMVPRRIRFTLEQPTVWRYSKAHAFATNRSPRSSGCAPGRPGSPVEGRTWKDASQYPPNYFA